MTIMERDTMVALQKIERKIPEITLRDYFAGQALAGIMTNITKDFGENPRERIAKICYDYADVMLEVRNEKK